MKTRFAIVTVLSASAAMLLSAVDVPAMGQDESLAASSGMQAEILRQAAKPRKEYSKAVFSVSMHCENCVKKIQENIAFEKGVKALEVSLDRHTVYIEYDPEKTDVKTLASAIEKLGYEVREITPENR